MKNVTRRSALGLFAAAGGATLLAACGSQSQVTSGSASASDSASGSASASASASESARSDYSGAAVLDGYTSKPADYQLATRTEPSKNAPVPVKPAVANENSVEGLYQSIAFFGAAMEYYMRTGKTEPLRESGLEASELKKFLEPDARSMGAGLQQGTIWLGDPTVTTTMLSAQPKREGDTYIWDIHLTIDPGEFIVAKGSVQEAPSESERKEEVDRTLHGVYENGAWKLSGMNTRPSSSAAASAVASASASAS